jgi:hypothetical protein
MIGTNAAPDRNHRAFCSRRDALTLDQCNRAGGLGISHGLDFLGDHPRALGAASCPASRYFEETQDDNILDLETKSHRVQPGLPQEHASIPLRSFVVVMLIIS